MEFTKAETGCAQPSQFPENEKPFVKKFFVRLRLRDNNLVKVLLIRTGSGELLK